MSVTELEQALRDLPRVGKLVKDRAYRQVWRFECAGKPYYLKFYPRGRLRDRFYRLVRGSKALLEFHRLQLLQKAHFQPAAFGLQQRCQAPQESQQLFTEAAGRVGKCRRRWALAHLKLG